MMKSILLVLFLILSCQKTTINNKDKIEFLCRHQKEYEIQSFKKIYRANNLKSKNFGFILYDPDRRKVLEKRNINKGFIPASAFKIATTLAALEILGPDYRFMTSLSYSGRIREGVLRGNLYLKGTGDPLLGSSNIMNMAMALKKKGIKKITGKFIYDDFFHKAEPQLDSNQEDHYSYNPGISALSSEFNRIYMHWDTQDKTTEYYFRPALAINYAEIPTENEIIKANHMLYNEEESTWILPKTSKKSGVVKLPVKNPSLYTATLLKKFVEFHGIKLPEPQNARAPRYRQKIYANRGMRVLDISRSVLEYSNNVMTELLLLATAKKLHHKRHNLKSAIQEVAHWYREKIPSANWKNFKPENGSGLSNQTRITPYQLLSILSLAHDKEYDKINYTTLLPTSGWTGTLRGRMFPPEVAFRIWAKTGSMHYASTMAGTLYTKSNRKLLFVIFVNDLSKRKRLDKTTDPIKKQNRIRYARQWKRRAKNAQDELLKRWVGRY